MHMEGWGAGSRRQPLSHASTLGTPLAHDPSELPSLEQVATVSPANSPQPPASPPEPDPEPLLAPLLLELALLPELPLLLELASLPPELPLPPLSLDASASPPPLPPPSVPKPSVSDDDAHAAAATTMTSEAPARCIVRASQHDPASTMRQTTATACQASREAAGPPYASAASIHASMQGNTSVLALRPMTRSKCP
jgi:hypothetical protein